MKRRFTESEIRKVSEISSNNCIQSEILYPSYRILHFYLERMRNCLIKFLTSIKNCIPFLEVNKSSRRNLTFRPLHIGPAGPTRKPGQPTQAQAAAEKPLVGPRANLSHPTFFRVDVPLMFSKKGGRRAAQERGRSKRGDKMEEFRMEK